MLTLTEEERRARWESMPPSSVGRKTSTFRIAEDVAELISQVQAQAAEDGYRIGKDDVVSAALSSATIEWQKIPLPPSRPRPVSYRLPDYAVEKINDLQAAARASGYRVSKPSIVSAAVRAYWQG